MNMRIGRKTVLIIECIVLVAALVSLYVVYSRQVSERNELNTELATARASLLPSSPENTEKEAQQNELAQAESTLSASQAYFPASVESIEYGEYLFEIAAKCNVKLASLTFPRPTGKTIGGATYSVVSLSLPVSGALTDIFEFIDTIRTDKRFASTDVKSINLNIGGSATISIDIYSYKSK
jgi:hypothetical protein